MKTYYITQTCTGGAWRSVRSCITKRDADWNAADMCNREEYGKYACKLDQVRTVEVQARDVREAFDKASPYRTELTDAGQQAVIPGCERDDARTGAKQMDLF